MRTFAAFLVLLTLSACNVSDATKPSASSSARGAAPASAGVPTSAGASTGAASTAKAPDDPLDDSGKPEASCESIQETGGCVEYFNLGFGAASREKACTASGRWSKGGTCPKEGRVAVCTTGADRSIYYASAFAPGNTVKDVGALCTGTLNGKFAEFPKKK